MELNYHCLKVGGNKDIFNISWVVLGVNFSSRRKHNKHQADLATGRERQLTTAKRAERTKHDFRGQICRSAIGQASCLICARRYQLTFPFYSLNESIITSNILNYHDRISFQNISNIKRNQPFPICLRVCTKNFDIGQYKILAQHHNMSLWQTSFFDKCITLII